MVVDKVRYWEKNGLSLAADC